MPNFKLNGNLVITRRAGEAFYIGDDVRVTVLSCGGGQARVSIEAPRDVIIAREEVRWSAGTGHNTNLENGNDQRE